MKTEKSKQLAKYCCQIGEDPLFVNNNNLFKNPPSLSEHDFSLKIVQEEITKLQIKAFLDFNFYKKNLLNNFPELVDSLHENGDDQGLIIVDNKFKIKRQWLEINDKALYISRSLPSASNGTLQLSDVLFNLCGNTQIILKIRSDCFKILQTSSASLRFEYADWYGKPFSLDWLKLLQNDQIAEHVPNRPGILSDGHCTQFLCSPRKDGNIHLCAEELPHKAEGDIDGADKKIFTRFVHAIFSPDKAAINHLDGAMHIYDKAEYKKRISQNLKEYNKNYLKTKIFRIDGNVNYKAFGDVVGVFYKWNLMATEYFKEKQNI